MLPTPRPTHRLQVVGSSCGQSLGAGGHRFKSDRPDQFPARGPSLRSGFRQRAPASLTPAKRLKFKSDRPDQSLRSISRRGKKRLPRLPAPRIAPAMEAGYHHNPVLLHLEEYAIREAPHSRPPTTSVDHGELQGVVCDCLNRGLDRQRETLPSPRRMLSYQDRAPANPHSPLGSRRPAVSRFLKQTSPDLLPRDDIGRVLLMPSDAVVKLRPLRIRE